MCKRVYNGCKRHTTEMWESLTSKYSPLKNVSESMVCTPTHLQQKNTSENKIELMSKKPSEPTDTVYEYVNCLIDYFKITNKDYIGPTGTNFKYGLERLKLPKHNYFNEIIFTITNACNLTDEETAQFWSIMAQESGASIDLQKLHLAQGMYGIAQINKSVWLKANLETHRDVKYIIDYLQNNCDFSNTTWIDPNILNNNKIKDYSSLKNSILENENAFSSVIFGIGIYKLFQERLITTNQNTQTPFTIEMFQTYDHKNSKNAMFAIGYEYHSPGIIRDGIKPYSITTGLSQRNNLNHTTTERTKQKLNHYFAYKHHEYEKLFEST